MNNCEYGKNTDTYTDAYAYLRRGRRPFASAALSGSAPSPKTCGSVDFYMTPLGVLVFARLSSLPCARGAGTAYNFCIREGEQGRCIRGEVGDKRSLCAAMPVAYERDGCAECGILTRRIEPCELFGKTVVVYDRINGCPKSVGEAIAFGRIICVFS